MKKFLSGLICGMIIMVSISGYALTQIKSAQYNDTKIALNGDMLSIKTPFITIVEEGQTNGFNAAPIRSIFEAMGYIVDWDKPSNTIMLETPLTDLETVVKNCKDSCVMIYIYKDDKVVATGSGFVYNGYVITAKHLTDLGNKYAVFLDDEKNGIYTESLVSIDTKLDVSALRTKINVPFVKLGDSSKLVEGEKLVSITSPGGVQNVVDECLFSGAQNYDGESLITLSEVETDGGSSGGAIFNNKSEIIAINTNGDTVSNLAIPINDIKPLLAKLK